MRPAIGVVAGADDQSRPDDDRAVAECVPRDLVAPRLHRPVLAHVFHVRRRELPHGVVLIDPDRREVGVGRNRRHEQVAVSVVAQQVGGHPDPARVGRRVVDHRVPLPAFERAQVVVAIAQEVFHPLEVVVEEGGFGLAAGEDRHLVPPVERVLDLVGTDEARAAQDEDALGVGGCARVGSRPLVGRRAGHRAERAQDAERAACPHRGLHEVAPRLFPHHDRLPLLLRVCRRITVPGRPRSLRSCPTRSILPSP